MKEHLSRFLEQFQAANTATKITIVMSTILLAGIVGLGTWFANRPNLVEHFTGLSAAQAAAYKAALAEAGIPFRSGPPPGPFSIYIDASDTIRAEAQVARGGYQPQVKGIQSGSNGAASAFQSAGERDQAMNKREWQECEKLLETLSFVERATVVGSKPQRSPFRKDVAPTISVTLGLRYGASINDSEARNVATLVRGRFNIPIENITILDENGALLHDGSDLLSGGHGDLFEQKRKFESDIERKVNTLLDRSLGPGMAYVIVNSDWTFDSVESVMNKPLKGEETYKRKTEDTTTAGEEGRVGGPAGFSPNITQDFGNQNAGVESGSGGGVAARTESKDEETRKTVGHETEHRVSNAPKIQRMSIALTVDASIAPEEVAVLNETIKAAVGFVEDRDKYQSFQTKLASVLRDDEGNPIKPEVPEPVTPPNQYVELLITHGVEILAGLAFIIILLKTLRAPAAAKMRAEREEAEAAVEEAEQEAAAVAALEEELARTDPALLARMRVEELVRNEPERVSEILAEWAAEEISAAGAGR